MSNIPSSISHAAIASAIANMKQKQIKNKQLFKQLAIQKAIQQQRLKKAFPSMPGARVFQDLKTDNPKVEWTTVNFSTYNFNWSQKYASKADAIKKITEAIVRLESNVIPSAITNKRPITIAFLNDNISSSIDIVERYTPETFAEQYFASFKSVNASYQLDATYNNALETRSRSMLHYMNVTDLKSKHYAATPWSASSKATANGLDKLPDFEGLFGSDAFMEVDQDYSVLSPAAYLFELKKTLDKHINCPDAAASFDNRRPDIGALPLTKKNTSSEVSKLEIVNNILEDRLKSIILAALEKQKKAPKNGQIDNDTLYSRYASSSYPLDQPFNLPFEASKQYLKLLSTDIETVWKTFNVYSDSAPLAAASFSSDYTFYATAINANVLQGTYGLPNQSENKSDNYQIPYAIFESRLGLTFQEVDEILAAGLSEDDCAKGVAASLYVNLDESRDPIQIVEGSDGTTQLVSNLTVNRLNKIIKLVKVSRDSGLSITELQWIFSEATTQIGQPTTNANFTALALPYVSKIVELKGKFSLSTDAALGLIARLKTASCNGDDPIIETVFPNLFQKKWDYHATDSANITTCFELQGSLGLNSTDFNGVVAFVANAFANVKSTSISNTTLTLDQEVLSALYRISKLMTLTELPFADAHLLLEISGGLELAGPIAKGSNNLASLTQFLEISDWLVSQDMPSSVFNYLITGKSCATFSDLSRDDFTKLIAAIADNVTSSLISSDILQKAIDSAVNYVVAAGSTQVAQIGDAELAGSGLASILTELKSLSVIRLTGMVLKIPDNNTLINALVNKQVHLQDDGVTNGSDLLNKAFASLSVPEGNYAGLGTAMAAASDDSLVTTQGYLGFLIELSKKIRGYLIYYRYKQRESIVKQIATALAIDDSLTTDLWKWSSYLIPSVSLFDIVSQETNSDNQYKYFNAYNRLLNLAKVLGLSPNDVSQLLDRPTIFYAPSKDPYEIRLNYDSLRNAASLAPLRKRLSDTENKLYAFQDSMDLGELESLGGWSADDLDQIIARWNLNGVKVQPHSVPPSFLSNDGATCISISSGKVALGYPGYNEIVILEQNGWDWVPVSFGGASGGTFGSSVALCGDYLLGLDTNHHYVYLYECTGRYWSKKNVFATSEAPVSASLNGKYGALAFESKIDVFLAPDLQQQSPTTYIKIETQGKVKKVFLDQNENPVLGYVTTDGNYYTCNFATNTTTQVSLPKGSTGSFGVLQGGLLIAATDANDLSIFAPQNPTEIDSVTDFATQSSKDLNNYEEKQSSNLPDGGGDIMDVTLSDGKVYLLTRMNILKVDLIESDLKKKSGSAFTLTSHLSDCFALSSQTGLSIESLLTLADLYKSADYNAWKNISLVLKNAIRTKYSDNDADDIFAPCELAMLDKKRDILIGDLLDQFSKTSSLAQIDTKEKLSEFLLIDVEVTALVKTSYVKEAISALQRYIYRCLMNVEGDTIIDSSFNSYWEWMKNYSVWEANRMVFLNPENYLDPDVRKLRSPLYDDFSGYLKQKRVSKEHVDKACNQYLDGFLSLSNLDIVNIWAHNHPDGSNEIFTIGRTTQSDGYKYYYRISSFKENDKLNVLVPDDWGVWKEINTKIPTKWITPIRAFGRLYVFWAEIQPKTNADSSDNKTPTSNVSIKCCFFNFRDKWSVPQTIAEGITISANPQTIQERDDKKYHNIAVSKTSDHIEVVYIFTESKQSAFLVDPHMRVTATTSSISPDLSFDDTNNNKGFLNLADAFSTPATGYAITSSYSSNSVVAGWFYSGDLKSDVTLLQLVSSDSVTKTNNGIVLAILGNKLALKSTEKYYVTSKPLHTSYTVEPNTWYYIGLQIKSDLQYYNISQSWTYSVPSMLVIRGSVSNKVLTGSPQYVLTTNFKSRRAIGGGMMTPNDKSAFHKYKKAAPSSSTTTLFPQSSGLIRNIAIFNTAVSLDKLKSLSGARIGKTPTLHISSDAFEASFVPNSNSQMILLKSEDASYLAINDRSHSKQYYYRITSSLATTFDDIYSSHVDGISALLSTDTQRTPELSFINLGPDESYVPRDYWPEDSFIDLYGADSLYYWELFFYIPLFVANSYNAIHDYESASKWYQYVFNPLEKEDAENSHLADSNDRFWQFIGLKTYNNPTLRCEHFGEPTFQLIDEMSNDTAINPKWDTHLPAISKYHDDPFDPHAIAQLRPIAYQKYVFNQYIRNLLDWADDLYRQNTRETLEEAHMLYNVASDLLGQRPIDLGTAPAPAVKSLNDLSKVNHQLSDFLVGIEDSLSFTGPINCSPISTPNNDIAGSYFSVPENEQFIQLWDDLENRLYNLRHQLTIDGKPNALPLFQPPANPMALISAVSSGGAPTASGLSGDADLPPYRYSTVFSKAFEAASCLSNFGSHLQSALYNQDAQALSKMRAKHEIEIYNMMDEIKKTTISEAQSQVDSANLSITATQYKKDYYDTLVNYGTGKKSKDVKRFQAAMALKDLALVYDEASAVCMAFAADMGIIQMLTAPLSGLIVGMADGGSALVEAPKGAGESTAKLGFAMQNQAGVFERVAAQLEQSQNYFLLSKEMNHQLETLDKRLDIAKDRLEIAQQNYAIHQKRIAQEKQVEAFYESKFLNEELFSWMAQRLTGLYKKTYDMALELALECQRCWQYEIGDHSAQFIGAYSWSDAHGGFLAGTALEADLLQMDKAYTNRNKRTFEITKYISLNALDPLAYLTLVSTGSCLIGLEESIFNADYPGHYNRRIKNVAITLSAKEKPLNVCATLTQLSSKIVTKPDIDIVSYLTTGKTTSGESSLSTEQAAKVKVDLNCNQQIATSSANNDSGIFTVSFAYDTRYLPFEGTGAVSTWKLDLGLDENPDLCATVSEATSATYFLATLNVDALIVFIEKIEDNPQLAGSFHKEIMYNLDKKLSVEDLAAFVGKAVTNPKITAWFKNLGSTYLKDLESRLASGDQKTASAQIADFLTANTDLPTDMVDTPFTDGLVLNISDITLKVCYTAENGGESFKAKVKTVNSKQ